MPPVSYALPNSGLQYWWQGSHTCPATCSMLEAIGADPENFEPEQRQQAQRLQAVSTDLQLQLLGRGLFRQFLSQGVGPSSDAAEVCGHDQFSEALSSILR